MAGSDLVFSGASRKDQPSFTLKQVSYLCERLLKDHEEKIREEYEQILNTKLAGEKRRPFLWRTTNRQHSPFTCTALVMARCVRNIPPTS